jgi:hypothetical protein
MVFFFSVSACTDVPQVHKGGLVADVPAIDSVDVDSTTAIRNGESNDRVPLDSQVMVKENAGPTVQPPPPPPPVVETEVVEEQAPIVVEVEVEEMPPFADHRAFDRLLKKYVTVSGNVDYEGFIGNPDFDMYLDHLSNNPARPYWTKHEKMAYWINAYNAFTIKLIVDNWPLESIKDINSPWKTDFFQIDGKSFDLNTIEHDILRPEFNDARIHFAINCASESCPKLLNGAYFPNVLDRQLEQAARDFINDTKRNDLSGNKLRISKIFDWFKGDFTKTTDVVGYLNMYANSPIAADASIGFLEYDWSLNGK